MRRRSSAALVLSAVMLLAGGGVVSGAEAVAVKRTVECQGDWLPATPTSEEVMAGELSFLGLPAVKVGKNVNWRWSPYKNRSWDMVFHSLRWMGRLVADYELNGKESYLRRAREIAKDWVDDNPRGGRNTSPYAWQEHPIALRAPALVCLSKHVGDDWLKKSLAEHGRMLADPRLYEKGHNHGIDQDIALLGVGCRYGRDEWSKLAIRRLTETVILDVDSQGALREQAPRYAIYVHQRLKVAIDNIKACDRAVPAQITKRWNSLETFIAHATQPNGNMVPIGDGGADVRPAGYDAPTQKVKVFGSSGYVFGRSSWKDEKDSAFYSIRFGPGLKYHGHEDHLGVTYFAQGRDVLVDVGFHSYENTPYRRWTMSPQAHNVPVVAGAAFRGGTPSKLVKSSTGGSRQSYRLTDRAYGVARTRSVLVNHGDDLMAVLDTAAGKSKISNIWHFDLGLTAAAPGGGRVVLRDKDWKATLVQVALPSCRPVSGLKVVRGANNPIQGWVSPSYLKKTPAPAVLSPASADPLLTVVVPGVGDPKVRCSGGKVTVETAGGAVSFTATPAGTLS
ncbi:heparinase II/III family protein [Spongiactinospora rosea]|uniref:heparinase II/III family protein n=1 Tax=Spongiactinospora rosea TaxID=2248750 RepID=UPI001CEC149D|nr:heparinase II/III family protein [Spongiactinospora rosea]